MKAGRQTRIGEDQHDANMAVLPYLGLDLHGRNMAIPSRLSVDLHAANMNVIFEVPGMPVPKARPRVTVHGTYTPEKTKTQTEWIKVHARQAMQGQAPIPKEQGVMLSVEFYRKRKIPARPDLVNYIALVADALQGIIYEDDCQVIFLMAHTLCADSNNERTWIKARQCPK